MDYFKHKSAVVEKKVTIGKGTKIWHNAHIREGARIGKECIIGQNVYIDAGVVIGDYTRIQNNASIYRKAIIGKFVFIGPNVVLTNDKRPKVYTKDGKPLKESDWEIGMIRVADYASIGAGAIILPNITIGEYSMIGAGSVVTKSVSAHIVVYGNPAVPHEK